MSKSLGNCIYLSDSESVVDKKVMSMYTDPTHLRLSDPGHVENNPVFIYLDAFHKDNEEITELKDHYRKGGLGDVTLKKMLASDLNGFLEPIRERRSYYKAHPELVREALIEGTLRAKKVAEQTMYQVRDAMKISGYEKQI
jgi:tryptophanyl-tRNA synthetase